MISLNEGEARADHTEYIRAGCRLTVLVYIRSYREGVSRGVIITLPDQEKYEFCGLDQMLLIMEDIMDASSGSGCAFAHRYLYQEPFVFRESGGVSEGTKNGGLSCLPGTKVTFTIQVCYRQHGSMQGRLGLWNDHRRAEISFRSSLELMRMMHEYLHRKAAALEKRAEN